MSAMPDKHTYPLPDPRPRAIDRAESVLSSEATERLLADVDELSKNVRDHMPTGQEVRVVDPTTGGAKGSKLARHDLVPEDVLELLAKHYGRGARKYEDRNWERGYKWSLSYAAMRRHMAAFWSGEDVDSDPALYTVDDVFSEEEYADDPALHIVAALWHAVALTAFSTRHIGTDDRPKAA